MPVTPPVSQASEHSEKAYVQSSGLVVVAKGLAVESCVVKGGGGGVTGVTGVVVVEMPAAAFASM